MLDLVLKGLWETIYMTVGATVLAYIVGLPLGLILAATAADGVRPNRGVNLVLGAIVNVLRSVPFLILLYTVIPVTRFIVGTAIGTKATIVPLFISAFPFVARLVESSAREVDRGVVEASLSMGASVRQVICKVILPEAKPSLINGAAIATTTILGYSAMAGVAGGGRSAAGKDHQGSDHSRSHHRTGTGQPDGGKRRRGHQKTDVPRGDGHHQPAD